MVYIRRIIYMWLCAALLFFLLWPSSFVSSCTRRIVVEIILWRFCFASSRWLAGSLHWNNHRWCQFFCSFCSTLNEEHKWGIMKKKSVQISSDWTAEWNGRCKTIEWWNYNIKRKKGRKGKEEENNKNVTKFKYVHTQHANDIETKR